MSESRSTHARPDAPTATQIAADIRSRRRDPVEVLEDTLERLAACEEDVSAFVHVDRGRVRSEAEQRAAEVHSGERLGPLHGVPVAVKDLFDVTGQVTTAGSQVPPDGPAAHDAAAVARLRRAGAVIVGRTRTHEFAWGVTTWHPALGGTRNPWALDRVPGGSSGGSAAAVAAGMVPLALGTDTACSVRLPAAWCGVVGHKPAYGTVPVEGVLPLSPSFDHVGTLAHDTADARLALSVLTGQTLDAPTSVAGLTLGIAAEGHGLPDPDTATDRALRATADRAARSGMRPRPASVPFGDRLQEIYRVVQAREALAWHRSTRRWPVHAHRYSAEIRNRLRFCEQVTAQQGAAAAELLGELREQVSAMFDDGIDLLLMPVAASGSPRIAAATVAGDDGPADLGARILPWTLLANLCGLPACSFPAGSDDHGLPLGLQVVGRPSADATVLDAAAELTDPAQ